MKQFNYYKLYSEMRKTCNELYKVRDEVWEQRRDLEYGDQDDENRQEIMFLRQKENHLEELLCYLEEVINELEWFTCVE